MDLDEQNQQDNTPQFNIIETNVQTNIVVKFCTEVLAHIFKYSKTAGTIDLNSEYENILMSKKINIIDYMNKNMQWKDVYDIKCTGVRVKKLDDNMRKKVTQWLTHDDNYYTSAYFYIATPGSLFEAYLLVITGKKNVLMAEQFDATNTNLKNIHNELIEQLTEQKIMHNDLVEKINSGFVGQTLLYNSLADKLNQGLAEQMTAHNDLVEKVNQNLNEQATAHNELVEKVDQGLVEQATTHNEIVEKMTKGFVEQTASYTELVDKTNKRLDNLKSDYTKICNGLRVEFKDNLDNYKQLNDNQLKTISDDLNNYKQTNDNQLKTTNDNILNLLNDTFTKFESKLEDINKELAVLNNKIEELSTVILPSGGEGYVIVK